MKYHLLQFVWYAISHEYCLSHLFNFYFVVTFLLQNSHFSSFFNICSIITCCFTSWLCLLGRTYYYYTFFTTLESQEVSARLHVSSWWNLHKSQIIAHSDLNFAPCGTSFCHLKYWYYNIVYFCYFSATHFLWCVCVCLWGGRRAWPCFTKLWRESFVRWLGLAI